MKISKTISLAGLLAVVAMVVMAVGASAASAHEFKAAAYPVTIKGTGEAAKFESDTGSTVTCEKSSSTGEIKNASEAEVTVSYSGKCKAKEGSTEVSCTEPIKTEKLKVEPVEIGGEGSKLGLLFSAATAGSKVLSKLSCEKGIVTITVEGEAVCESEKGPSAKSTVTCKEEEEREEPVPGEQMYTTVNGGTTEHTMTATATKFFIKGASEEDAQVTTEHLTYTNAKGEEVSVEQN